MRRFALDVEGNTIGRFRLDLEVRCSKQSASSLNKMAEASIHLLWCDRNLCSGSVNVRISKLDCTVPSAEHTSLAGLPISLNATGTGTATPDMVSNCRLDEIDMVLEKMLVGFRLKYGNLAAVKLKLSI